MPGLDGTGPDFSDPMTGGARGWCAGKEEMIGTGYERGQGFGRVRGRRQGGRRVAWPGMGVRPFSNRLMAMAGADAGNEALLYQMKQQAASIEHYLQARIESLKSSITA